MVRELDWRDLALLHRVRDRGLCPDSQLALTRGPHALQSVFLDTFVPGKAASTLVARTDEIDAVGQCIYRNGETNARLSFIAPAEALESDSGLELVEALAAVAGEHGAHNLVADVDVSSQAFEQLRKAGFAVYARQRIWTLDPARTDFEAGENGIWRIERGQDEGAVGRLYRDIVPGLVQQVEPSPTRPGHNLVLWEGDELLGYLDIEKGSLGTWVQPFLHPAVEDFQRILTDFLAEAPDDRPLYLCVRSYQSWMAGPLERMEFAPTTDQAVLVKRLAAVVRKPALGRLPAVEGSYPEPTAPITHGSTINE